MAVKKHAHLWPHVEARYLAGAGPQELSAETGIPVKTINSFIYRNALALIRDGEGVAPARDESTGRFAPRPSETTERRRP